MIPGLLLTEFSINNKKNTSMHLISGQGEADGPYWGHRVTERGHCRPEKGSSYSPGAVDTDYSLSVPMTSVRG